jgi:flagella basal body P-ring formation protein FlgA
MKPGSPFGPAHMSAVPARRSMPAPTMPALPVIEPTQGFGHAPALSARVVPVTVEARAASAPPVAALAGTAAAINGGAVPLPGHLPEPVIDPSIGSGNPAAAAATTVSIAPGAADAPVAAAAAAPAPPAPRVPLATVAPASAQPGKQSDESIRAAAEQFLLTQTVGFPGQVAISITPTTPRGLPECASLEPFLAPGARVWGRTTVGVRCVGEHPWTMYLQARVAVNGTYFISTRDIAPGQIISAADVSPRQADLTNLPRSVVTDLSQVVGKAALSRITPGIPVREDLLHAVNTIEVGQPVKLVAEGPGFSVSYEGSALGNAALGQSVRVRTVSGQIVSGVVRDRGTVVVPL